MIKVYFSSVMKNSKKMLCFIIMLFLVICILTVSSTAYAHVVPHNPRIGTYNYASFHQHWRYTDAHEWVYTSFYSIHRVSRYSNQSAALISAEYIGYNNCDPRVYYGITHIWDSYGFNFQQHWDFFGVFVRNRRVKRFSSWAYYNFNSSNHTFITDQYLYMDDNGGITVVGHDSAAFKIYNPSMRENSVLQNTTEDGLALENTAARDTFQIVRGIDEASKAVSFRVSTLTDILPHDYQEIKPYTYVTSSPADEQPMAVIQIWSVKGKEEFIALSQSPSLSGIVGGRPSAIDKLDRNVQVHIVKNNDMPPIYIIYWQHDRIGYSLAGTLTQDLTKNLMNEIARSFQ